VQIAAAASLQLAYYYTMQLNAGFQILTGSLGVTNVCFWSYVRHSGEKLQSAKSRLAGLARPRHGQMLVAWELPERVEQPGR
jgi:hypothetical protein